MNLASYPHLSGATPAPVVDGALRRRFSRSHSISLASPEVQRRQLARYANPVVPNMADRQAWELYDRLTVNVGTVTAANYIFFQSPISGTKTKNETNLIQAGRLEDPQRFFVTALRFIFSSDMLSTDIVRFLKNYYVEFWVGQKIYQEGPLVLFPGGAGVSGHSTLTDDSNWNHGFPSPQAINLLGEEGIWILQGQQFRAEVKTSAAFTTSELSNSQGLNILCVLDGILYRQVQ
jgi:hypothetical protein